MQPFRFLLLFDPVEETLGRPFKPAGRTRTSNLIQIESFGLLTKPVDPLISIDNVDFFSNCMGEWRDSNVCLTFR